MKILIVISARGGSKGVPRKNIRDLAGKPLISHAVGTAVKAKYQIDGSVRVICNTDDLDIAATAQSYGAEVPFLREQSDATDDRPLIASTKEAMLRMDGEGFKSEIIVQLAPTCPFIGYERICEAVEILVEDSSLDCVVSLKQIEHDHPYRARILGTNNLFTNFVTDIPVEAKEYHSRQDLPKLFATSGGLYVRRRYLLDEFDGSDFAMGKNRYGVVMSDVEAVNIDREIDFAFAEFLVASGRAKLGPRLANRND